MILFIFVVAYLRRSKRSYLYFYHIWCFRLLWLWVWWIICCIFFVILRWSFSFIGSGREVDINCFVVCKQYFIRVVDCIIILDERVMFKGILLVRLICLLLLIYLNSFFLIVLLMLFYLLKVVTIIRRFLGLWIWVSVHQVCFFHWWRLWWGNAIVWLPFLGKIYWWTWRVRKLVDIFDGGREWVVFHSRV